MTNSQPPLSPNSAVDTPASPVPKWSDFRPIEAPASPASPSSAYAPQPYAPPLSPASPYSTSSSSAPWSPGTATSATSPLQQEPNTRQPRRYNEDDEAIQDLFIERSLTDHYRVQAAKHRSLTLLETHAESSQAPMASASMSSANRDGKDLSWNEKNEAKNVDTKGFIDRNVTEAVRLQGSKQRSLALLETYAESARPRGTDADRAYHAKLKSIPRENEINDHQATHRRKNMHMMASSSRNKKPLTAEDVRDPETVAGMKTQLDWDREKAAEKKALLLLDIMAMF